MMAGSGGLMVLLLGAVGLAALALALTAFALLNLRWRLRRRRAVASRRDWRVESVDPIAGLRSPYKTEPMCERCLTVERNGAPPFFVCQLNERCGLLVDEPAGHR